jgi:diaminopimelate decarboxylase
MTVAVTGTHPTIERFLAADGSLHIGGNPIGLLAARVGNTPFFAYERTAISRRVDELRRALPGDIHLSYAVKANPMPAVVQHLSGQVDGFDVASVVRWPLRWTPPCRPSG